MLLSHDDTGSGHPLLFLHAGVADRRMWAAQVAAFATRNRVVAPDLRGFGETGLPPEDFSNADDIAALMDALSIERATLVGASFGGRVALEVATVHPQRVDRLVLLAPAFRGVESTTAADALDEQEDAFLEAGDINGAVDLAASAWLGPDASEDARDLVRAMQRRAYDIYLAAEAAGGEPASARIEVEPSSITAETLVVSGMLDVDLFPIVARHLVATMPHARLVELSWAGHLPSLERPEKINDVIADYLDGTTA